MQNKKALFLTQELVSHAHDTFYHGMVELLGEQNVFDCPCVVKYHKNHLIPGDQYSWWCYSDNKHLLSLTLEGWANEINNGNIQYIFSTNRDIASLEKLIPLIHESRFKDLCITFIEEEHDLGFEIHRNNVERLKPVWNKIDLYYRVDYIKSRVASYDKIKPIYISAPEDKILAEIGDIKPFKDRQIDICYVVGASHPNRKMFYDILKGYSKGSNIIEYGTHKYSLKEYLNLINDSKIFFSVRGNEWSNTRNIEGPYCGAALFTEELEITVPFEYENRKSAVFYNKSNVLSLLDEYMSDQTKLERLATASRQHCLKFHTARRRAEQFIQHAKQVKGW